MFGDVGKFRFQNILPERQMGDCPPSLLPGSVPWNKLPTFAIACCIGLPIN
jgi:hypothetical protein